MLTQRQLRRAGISARAERNAVDDGRLIELESTVLAVAGSADTWLRRLQTGLLALGGSAWVSHEAAAVLLGLDRSRPGSVEFTVPRAARRALRAGSVHTTTAFIALDVVTVDGLACSSATRTIIDLAYAGTRADRLGPMMDSAVHRGLSAPQALAERLQQLRGPGRHGAPTVDRVLVDSGGESPLERRFLALMRRAGLPRPTTQHVVRRDGRHVARVDFVYLERRLVVEVTGRKGHSSPAERQRDAQRRNELADLGYRVVEYTWEDVTLRADYVIDTMRARLTAAA